jgi:hypothetical protein
MNSSLLRIAPLARRLVTVAAVAAGLGAVMPAQAQVKDWIKPGTVYVAGSLGLMDSTYECEGAPTCEHVRIGGKTFGGYRMTPNLAAEVGFYYLGKFSASKQDSQLNQNDTGARAAASLQNTAVSFGLDWSNEMFGVARQHIRFGLARVKTKGTESLVGVRDGAPIAVNEHTTEPFIGLGLSYKFNEYVRFYSSYDTMRNRRNEHFHMFSMGLGVEN